MPWKLFIDDDRYPESSVENRRWRIKMRLPSIAPLQHDLYGPWVIARSHAEAVHLVENLGFPSFVSFDHDLGPSDETGHTFAKYLVDLDLDTGELPDNFAYEVHSGNSVGRQNIHGLLGNYLEFRAKERASKASGPAPQAG